MSLGAQGTEPVAVERLLEEINGQLNRARTSLALAHRHAAKMPLAPEDQQKSKASFADAIGQCVTATRAAKAANLFKLMDSGLNPSEIRQCVQRALTKPSALKPAATPRGGRAIGPNSDRRSMTLMLQLEACRRINLEGLRWLTQAKPTAEEEWRGAQLIKIAEQLCVITALESKLLGVYVLGDPRDEPSNVRKAVNRWASEATRQELDGE